MIIAVDFDGTIVEHKYPSIGKEIPFAFEVLKKLQQDNHRIILWSVREGNLLKDAVEFCRSNGLEFYAVNAELPGNYEVGRPRKVDADIYIDDHNLGGVPDWPMIYRMISEKLTMADVLAAQGEDTADVSLRQPGSGSSHHSHRRRRRHRHRKSIFRQIVERCRNARSMYERR